MITFVLSLTLITSAFADEYAPAAVDGEQASEELGRLAAQALQAEARAVEAEKRLAALEAERAKCPKGCSASKAKKPAATPAPTAAPQQVEITPISPAPVDPELEQAKADLKAATEAYKAAEAKYDLAAAALQPPTVNVTVQPAPVNVQPVVLRTETAQVEVHTSGFHPTFYLSGGATFGPPLEGGTPGYAWQVALGARPTWDISEHGAFGLVIEGSYGSGGPGVRGIATILRTGQFGEVGIGVGPSYSCDDLEIGEGCFAEHIGGTLRGSAGLQVAGFGGVLLHADTEFNYLTLDGALEVREVIGLGWYFGNSHPATVTVE